MPPDFKGQLRWVPFHILHSPMKLVRFHVLLTSAFELVPALREKILNTRSVRYATRTERFEVIPETTQPNSLQRPLGSRITPGDLEELCEVAVLTLDDPGSVLFEGLKLVQPSAPD